MINVREAVFESLNIGVGNAPEIVHWEAIDLACELVDCDGDFENFDPKNLVPYVMAWQQNKREDG